MRIRDAQGGDEQGLATLAALGDDLGQFSIALIRPEARVRVATGGEALLGAAASWRSTWHPRWNWAHVAVSLAHRRQGVGSALLADLLALGPVKTKVSQGSVSAQFAESAGLHVIQTSANYVVAGQPTDAVGGGLDPHPRDCVADAYLAFYRRAHQWDPVGAGITAKDMLAATVQGATCTLLVGAPERPDAVGCMWEAGEAWEFSGGPCHDRAQPATDLLLDHARAVAGSKLLVVEADSDMSEMLMALQRRGAEPTDVVHIVAGSVSPVSTPRFSTSSLTAARR